MAGAHQRLKPSLRAASAAGTLCLCAGAACGQVFEWGVQFGSPAFDTALGLAPDGSGGVYLAGGVAGSVGGPHFGGNDAYLARYSRGGGLLWQRQFGTGGDDRADAALHDAVAGLYVAGTVTGALGGPHVGGRDNFLARYSAAGDLVWIRQLGTESTEDSPTLAPDGAGGVYLFSGTQGSLGAPNQGSLDAYLARYDGAGTLLWLRQFGTPGVESPSGAAPDGAGGVFIGGWTNGPLGGPNLGLADAWVARYDGEGTRVWLVQFGTTLDDRALACAPDGNGGAYVAGETYGDLAGPVGGSFPDAFVARYDADGNRVWVRQFGAGVNVSDTVTAAAPDGAGGVLVAGHTRGSLGGPNAGNWDVFFGRYGADGERRWIGQFGTSGTPPFGGDDRGLAIASDGTGGAYVGGNTNESLWATNMGDKDAILSGYRIACYPDCDTGTGTRALDIFDFLCFQNHFVAGIPYACDCDTGTGQGVCDVFDFLCFQREFTTGCP